MDQALRILIVDDSPLVRRLLRRMLADEPEIVVVGEAGDGREALAQVAALRPSLVILDVRMPVMDGVETTRQIMAYYPTPILVLTASLSTYDVDITFQMLGLGALDVMEKPQLSDSHAIDQARRALIRKIKLLSRVKVVTHLRGRREARAAGSSVESPRRAGSAEETSRRGGSTVDTSRRGGSTSAPKGDASSRRLSPVALIRRPVVVIGASTGGPRVLRQILSGLPADLAAAVLVVQHIAQGFSAGMTDWLATSSTLPVSLAREGERLIVGQALVAPDRFDLLVQSDGTVHLSGLPLLLQRPAVDIAMQSVAEVYGPAAIGVLLTGMGRDGAIGMQSIRRAGGLTIAQDEASCTIYGMPRAAVELGAAELVLPPDKIVEVLIERVASASLHEARR